MEVGANAQLSVTVSGGTAPYLYSWSGLPGCSGADSSTLDCTPTEAGSFSLEVSVTDAVGAQVLSSALPYVVAPQIQVSVASDRATLDAGMELVLNATTVGGVSPYSFTWANLPVGCVGSTSGEVECAPSTPGAYTPDVTVTDGDSARVAATFPEILVSTDPQVGAISETRSTSDVGQSVAFGAPVVGGALPLAYSWHGLPAGCVSRDTNSISCSPTAGGSYSISVTVSDSNGYTATSLAATSLAVSPSLASQVTFPSTGSILNQPVLLTGELSGGLAPYSESWTNLPTGCTSADSLSLNCTPTRTGSFEIGLQVEDSNGAFSNSTSNLTVESPASTSGPLSSLESPSSVTLILLLALGLVLVATAVLLIRRRTPPRVIHPRRGQRARPGDVTHQLGPPADPAPRSFSPRGSPVVAEAPTLVSGSAASATTPLAKSSYCPYCGGATRNDHAFCRNCGKRVREE